MRERIVDDPDERSSIEGESKRYADVGEGMDKIRSTVDWIYDEGWFRRKTRGRSCYRRLFTQEAFAISERVTPCLEGERYE